MSPHLLPQPSHSRLRSQNQLWLSAGLYFVCYLCCCCLVAKACLTLWNPKDCSMPGSPVFHYFLEFAQIHVHWVGNAIQPSHPLLPPSLCTFNLSQHQNLFQWVGSSHQVAKELALQLQHQSFQWIFRTNPLGLGGLISAVQGTLKCFLQYQSESINSLVLCLLCGPTLTSIHDYWRNHSLD